MKKCQECIAEIMDVVLNEAVGIGMKSKKIQRFLKNKSKEITNVYQHPRQKHSDDRSDS